MLALYSSNGTAASKGVLTAPRHVSVGRLRAARAMRLARAHGYLACALQEISLLIDQSHMCREYLLKHGDELKQSLPSGTQIITEIRRNHHPEIRANYGALASRLCNITRLTRRNMHASCVCFVGPPHSPDSGWDADQTSA